MEHTHDHIDYDLAAKYLSNECTESEMSIFEAWVNLSDDNKKTFNDLKTMYSVDFSAQEIDIDDAWTSVSKKTNLNTVSIDSSSEGFSMYGIAASIALLIGISAAVWWMNQDSMNAYQSGNQMANVLLIDGTQVTLGEHSIIEYPESFDGNTREVNLRGDGQSGKAYFKVASNKEQPFIIHTSGGDVEVVGTAFEVQTDMDDQELLVSVEEGIVEVSNVAIAEPARVTAGEIAVIGKEVKEITINTNESAAPFYWKDKTIKFKRTELGKVVEALNSLLQMDIRLESENLARCELTVTFTNESPDTIIEIIAMTLNLDLSTEGKTYVLSGPGC